MTVTAQGSMSKEMSKAEAAQGEQKKKIMADIKELQASMAGKAKKRPASSEGAASAASSKRPRSGPILSGGPVLQGGPADYRHGGRKKRPPQPCRFGAACKRKGRGCKFSHVEKVEKVEKAPQKPTVKRRKSGWDFAGHPAAPADAWTIKVNSNAVASTLEASVPQGDSHPSLLIPNPRLYRARLPSPPPMKTARKFIRG